MIQPNAYAGTSITEPPTMSGVAGSAWRVSLPPLGERGRPDWDATVDLFIIRVPDAHPFWDHWFVSLIHLRPIEHVKPPHIRTAGATHEFMIATIDPEHPLPGLEIGTDDKWRPRFLTPIDVVEQFTVADDAVADRILELGIRAIVNGVASPDQDWRGWWTSAIAKTAAHYNDGTHTVPRPS